jgi:hypothetical protein
MSTPSVKVAQASRIGRPATDLLWVVGGFALLLVSALRGRPYDAKPVKIRRSRNAESR